MLPFLPGFHRRTVRIEGQVCISLLGFTRAPQLGARRAVVPEGPEDFLEPRVDPRSRSTFGLSCLSPVWCRIHELRVPAFGSCLDWVFPCCNSSSLYRLELLVSTKLTQRSFLVSGLFLGFASAAEECMSLP